MPVKRRASKRKPAIHADAFAGVFECGFDYFDELAPFGLVDPVRLRLDDRERARAAWLDALRDAWGRHGNDFMAAREPGSRTPWALEAFGPPEEMENSTCR